MKRLAIPLRSALVPGAALVLGTTLLAGCGGNGLYAATPVMTLSATAPASNDVVGLTLIPMDEREPLVLSGEAVDGSPLSTADLAGDVIVVNAWASWCAPCREELPLLSAAFAATRDQGASFLGVNALDDPIAAAGLLASSPYPSINDRSGAVLATIPGVPPKALPSTVILDRQGRVAVRIIGPVQPGQLEPVLASLLAES